MLKEFKINVKSEKTHHLTADKRKRVYAASDIPGTNGKSGI
jgi:hypothetical protein